MPNTAREWKSIIIRHPIVFSLDAEVRDAIASLSRQVDRLDITEVDRRNVSDITISNCVVIVDCQKVVGLFTERDVVRLVAQGLSLEQLTLRQASLSPPITVRESALTDLVAVLHLFQQQHLTHLPILNDTDQLVGLITCAGLQQVFNSILISPAVSELPAKATSETISETIAQSTSQTIPQITPQAVSQTLSASLSSKADQPSIEAQYDPDQRWQIALQGSKVGIWDWDLRENVKFYSQSWKQSRGFQDHEISNSIQECFGRIHPEDYEDFRGKLARLQSGEAVSFEAEYRSRCKDGSYIWILDRGQALQDKTGRVVRILGTEIDITDRKTAELALKESQMQLQRIADNVPEVIYSYLIRPNQQFECIYINSQIRDMFELEPEVVLQNPLCLRERIHPDDLATVDAKVQAAVSTLQPFVSEHRLILPRKGLRWVKCRSCLERLQNGDVIWNGFIVDISDRKQSEQQLQAVSDRLEIALEGSNIGIWEWDYQTQKLIWDDRMFSIYKVRPEEFDGTYQDWQKRVHWDDLEYAKRNSESPENRFVKEFRIIHPDNSIRHIFSTALIQRDEQGQLTRCVGINLDITERKQAEQQLEELSNRLELAVQSAQLGVWQWDVQSDRLTFDDRMLAIYGLSPAAFEGTYQAWLNLIHPDDLAKAQVSFTPEDNLYTREFRIIRPDGGIRYLFASFLLQRNSQGELIRLIGTNLDISERKQVELALEQEVSRRTAIFNTSSDAIHIIDQQGNLIEANASFIRLLGYTSEEAMQLNVADWNAQYTRSEIQAMLQNFFWNTSEVWRLETLHRRKDGSILPVEIAVCSMEWNQQHALVCASRDISERRQVEQQQQRINEELARTTRLKDEFLANMSHELRTPLNAILGSTEILQEETFGQISPNQRKYLQVIGRSGTHLLALINEILDLAKIESGQVELEYSHVAVKHLAEFSLSFVKQQALGKQIQLHLRLPHGLPDITLDQRRIGQVLINLLSNAVKFTSVGGHVTLEVVFLPASETRQNYLRFNVSDTGIGIAPEQLKKLFQPFVQIDSALNRQYEGTGLGLALVKQIVELHHGQVSVTSEVGVGSCFSIELPYLSVESIPASRPAIEPSSAPPQIRSSTTVPLILIAEDNDINVSVFASYLEAKGYRIQVATNGRAALELAEAEAPDLILIDIQMPEMDGLMAIQRMRQLPALTQTPIIALTALAMQGDRERCLAAGATAYLSKPVQPRQLILSIESLLR